MAKSMFFDCYGPFDVERAEFGCRRSQSALWAAADGQANGLSGAIGCYLFGIRHGNRIRPWYVGMTIAKGGFAAEAFQQHKLDIYADCLTRQRGSPVLFLFPLHTPTNRFSSGGVSNKRTILWLERTLMGLAFAKNPEISNVRDMTSLRSVEVLGLLGPKRIGRPYREVQAIRKVLLSR